MQDEKRTSPFWEYIQIQEIESNNLYAEIRCNIFPDLLNLWGSVHGGVLATLIDVSIGSAVRSSLNEEQRSATVDLKINYLRPAQGTFLLAKARLSHKGGTLAVGTSEIFDDKGELVAIGTATFIMLKKGSNEK